VRIMEVKSIVLSDIPLKRVSEVLLKTKVQNFVIYLNEEDEIEMFFLPGSGSIKFLKSLLKEERERKRKDGNNKKD